jgi:hypothetical protein
MAWQARLAAPIVSNGDAVNAAFEYYDDVDPATVLAYAAFSFPPTWTNADMQSAVRARGALFRAANARATALALAFPAQTTVISIP